MLAATTTMMPTLQPGLWDRTRFDDALVFAGGDDFRRDFAPWLRANWHIYLRFERMALRLIRAGAPHFGPMDIVGAIRWGTALREARTTGQEPDFKINNNKAPDLSRLFGLMNPPHRDFFRRRVRGRKVRGLPGPEINR
jgi:hypothetical protein